MANKKVVGELVYEIKGDDTEYSKVINRADQSTENLSKTMSRSKGVTDNLITSLAGAYLGYQGVTKAIEGTIGEAIAYESAFAGVRKTVDGTEEQLGALSDRFIELSKTMPVSAEELAKIGELAGQLGVPIEKIDSFAETIAKIGVSTNLTTETAATDFARFANIMQMPLENVDRLGATIVELGNNMATTESEIDAMAMRIAGAGATLGLTEPQVLGWAAALSSVGIEAEAGGSSISRLMIDLSASVSKGGKDLDNFAKVAGMSSAEFKKRFKEDANGALKDFFDGLSRIKGGGGDVLKVLDSLGITEVRQRDAVLRLTSANDKLTQGLDTANKGWSENNALNNEANKRFATTESQLKILKNNWADLGRQLGVVILPIVNLVIKFFLNMADTIGFVSTAVKNTVKSMGNVVALSLIGAVEVLEKFINGAIRLANDFMSKVGIDKKFGEVKLASDELRLSANYLAADMDRMGEETKQAFFKMSGGSKDAADRSKDLANAQTLLKKNTGDTNKDIEDLVNSLGGQSKASKEAAEEAKKLAENQKKLKQETGDLADKGKKALTEMANQNVKDIEKIDDKIKDLRKSLADLKADLDKDIQSNENDIAGKIVEEKAKIAELKQKITDEKSKGEKANWLDIKNLQDEMDKREAALNNITSSNPDLAPEIQNADRRAGLTDLQRSFEDYTAKKAQILQDYNDKKAKLDSELALEEENKTKTVELYNQKQEAINAIIATGNQRFQDLANKRVKITEDEVTKQIAYYNKLAEAIAAASKATRTTELPKYSVGGYVPNGGIVHAGEYVIPAHMVAKYGGLINALEGVRTGNVNNSTVNNNVTLNNSINEQVDMDAVLKQMSFELNK